MKIAVIGANLPSLSFYKQAKFLGYEIHAFAWLEGAVCKEYADFFYPISITDREEICAICRNVGINGIISFSLESALPTVNYVARILNLPGNPPESEELMEDKFSMRQRLKDCGILVPQYLLVDEKSNIEQLFLNFPSIVKPVDSGGSRGVTKVNKNTELKSACARAMTFSKSKRLLIEQFIEGREFSVEYLSNEGKHYFLAITDKVTTGEPYFVEVEHHQPASISNELANKIKALTESTLNALKIFSSASHTEIKQAQNGELYIIEVGARMGGDMITSDLVRLSTGYDMVKGAIQVATSTFEPPKIETHSVSGVYFLSKEREWVLKYIENSKKYPEIIASEYSGNALTAITESNDRAGYFIYQSSKRFMYESC